MKINFLVLIIFLIQIMLKLILDDFGYVNTLASQIFVVFLPTIIYLMASKKKMGYYFRIKKNKILTNIIVTILTVISVNIVSLYFNYPIIKVMEWKKQIFQVDNSVYEIIINVIVLCIIPAIFEEILFRGIVLGEMSKKYSFLKASIISSLIFAIIHLDIINIFPQFVLGMFLCYITLSVKSVLLPIIAHFCNNLFSLFAGEYIIKCLFQNGAPVFLLALVIFVAGVVYFKIITPRR